MAYGILSRGLENIAYSTDLMDVLLPFFLIFLLVFAVLQRTKLFGNEKKYNVAFATILGLLVVIPHVTNSYPSGLDVVDIINTSLPSVALIVVACLMALILMGLFGGEYSPKKVPSLIVVLSLIAIIYIFGSSAGFWGSPSDIWNWWDDDLTSVIIAILVFGLIVWFITSEPGESKGVKIIDEIGNLFKK